MKNYFGIIYKYISILPTTSEYCNITPMSKRYYTRCMQSWKEQSLFIVNCLHHPKSDIN